MLSGGGGTPIWNRRGCSSEILNLTPKGDHLGVAQAFLTPKGDQSGLDWLKKILTPKNKLERKFDLSFYSRNPKRDLGGLKYWRFALNTLRETKIQNLHP